MASLTITEKPIAFFRACAILSIVLVSRFVFSASRTELINIDFVLCAACAYCFISLFAYGESRMASYVYFVLDTAAISALSYFTGGTKSVYSVLFYATVMPFAVRNGATGALAGSTLSSLPYVFLLAKDPLDYRDWGFFASSFYALSLCVTQFTGMSETKMLKVSLKSAQDENALFKKSIENLKSKVAEETIFDPLTGHHNIKYFSLKLEEEMSKARRHKYPFSLAIINVDNFKQYNAAFGHAVGDEALKVLSRLLAAYVRTSDLVSREDGKDKFVLLLPYTEGENAKIPLERYMEAVSRYRFDDKNPNVNLTVSVGVATFPQDAGSEQELMEKAEFSLRRAKVLGKNKIFTYPAAMQMHV